MFVPIPAVGSTGYALLGNSLSLWLGQHRHNLIIASRSTVVQHKVYIVVARQVECVERIRTTNTRIVDAQRALLDWGATRSY